MANLKKDLTPLAITKLCHFWSIGFSLGWFWPFLRTTHVPRTPFPSLEIRSLFNWHKGYPSTFPTHTLSVGGVLLHAWNKPRCHWCRCHLFVLSWYTKFMKVVKVEDALHNLNNMIKNSYGPYLVLMAIFFTFAYVIQIW